jgi:hypothetical protein
MRTINKFKIYSFAAIVFSGIAFTSCSDNDDVPEEENHEEVITDVKLIFTNNADATDIVEALAQDPDGEGVEELKILSEITLDVDKSYTMTFEIMNNLDPNDPEDIGEEIKEEDFEHQIFFSFSENAFANPIGNGNTDNASDPLNYSDEDVNGNPVGLVTSWTTGVSPLTGGTFTVRLQHQPDIKTATTGATDGDSDFELTFVLNIE